MLQAEIQIFFKIQGSNNGSDWTDIYSYSNNGTSPWGSDRLEVIKWTGGGDDFDTPAPYSYFRYYVTSVVSGSMHQINEIEYFGTADATPTLSSSTPADDATDVSVSDNIVLNFSENVDAEIGNITIKKNLIIVQLKQLMLQGVKLLDQVQLK